MDVNNNLPVAVDGDQAIIGTDVYSSAGQTAHAQVMKVAWGDSSNVNRATTTTPLPVQIYGLTGTLSTVTVTGSVRGLGTFTVGNTAGSPVYVTGGVISYVQGITNGVPVVVTGGVNILSSVGITGTVSVTAGRPLQSATDSVTVGGGTVGRNWSLNFTNDTVKVYGSDGGLTLPVRILGANGTVIGASGDALKVNIVNTGFSASITFAAVVDVQNAPNTVMRVQGTANGTPIPISGTVSLSDDTVTIANKELFMDVLISGVTYAGGITWPSDVRNIEKLLAYYESDAVRTMPWFLNQLRYDIAAEGGGTGSISNRLNQLVTDGSNSRTAPFTGVRTFNNTTSEIKTWRVALNSTTPVLLDVALKSKNIKHGVTIKNMTSYNIMIGTGISSPATSYTWSAPTSDDSYGIYLNAYESIFIPNSINQGLDALTYYSPLYGKIADSGVSSLTALSIMAV